MALIDLIDKAAKSVRSAADSTLDGQGMKRAITTLLDSNQATKQVADYWLSVSRLDTSSVDC